MLEPKEFERGFRRWLRDSVTKIAGETVSIDEKTLCGSRGEEEKAAHMVSAWVNQQRLVLGQIKVDDKSNEIAAVPQLLDMIDVDGCVITADAMSCQKEIVKKIAEKQADYAVGLKGTVRAHLGIENSLHWCLDVAFREDHCRARKDHSAENFAVIRHIALNMLKQDTSKMSLRANRHRCAYDDAFLLHILHLLM